MRADTVFVRCKNCGTINRLPVEKMMSKPKCGKCKNFLEFLKRPVEVASSDFDNEVIGWPGAVLVEFWSPRCGHCLSIAPVLEELAHERAGILKFAKVNIENEPSLAMRFQIRATPTMMLYRNGIKLAEIAGGMPKAQLEAWIDASLLG
jgi:thioredoxin 2